jgi:hypothetical protein
MLTDGTFRADGGPNSERWNVLSAGHSLEDHLSRYPLLDGPVVAVNHALSAYPASDYWCVMEPPRGGKTPIWDAVERPGRASTDDLFFYGLTLWAKKTDVETSWRERFPTANMEPCDPAIRLDRDRTRFAGQGLLPWPGASPHWFQTTFQTSLALAICRGAKQIQVLGASMSGEGGHGYQWVSTDGATNWSNRWEKEREWLQISCSEAAEGGIEIAVKEAEWLQIST